MNPIASPPYQLSAHVHACHVARHVVFLDLKRDSYLGITARDCEYLSEHIRGLPRRTIDNSFPEGSLPDTDHGQHEDTDLLGEMLEQGMLTSYSDGKQLSSSISIERPRKALIEGYIEVPTQLRLLDIAKFMMASATTAARMRWGTINGAVARVRNLRCGIANTRFDIERARRYVTIFNRLRPLVYTESNECLFSSLTMHEYLRRCRLFPRLVFGVATDPFRAHCWLQQADVVINDIPEYVREYTPILVV